MYRRFIYGMVFALVLGCILSTAAQAQERGRSENRSDPQTFASILGQRMTAYLQNIKSSFERNEGLSDTEKQDLVSRISRDISALQSQTAALGRAEDQAMLKQRLQELRDSWNKLDRRVKYYVSVILSNHVRFAIDRLGSIEVKIDALIVRLDDAHPQKADIMKSRDEFANQLAAAETAYTAARDVFARLENAPDMQEQFKQGKDKLKEANTSLRTARQTFRSILQNLKQALPAPQPAASSTEPAQP